MPFTPFHFGPAFFIGILFASHVNMAAILFTSVAIDIEPIYCLASDSCPLHGFLHTYVGTTLLSAVAVPIIYFGRKPLQKLSEHLGLKQDYSVLSIIIGTLPGGWSHIFLDSFLYPELEPFWPVTDNNPFVGLLSSDNVYLITVLGFVGGAAIYFWKLRNIIRTEKADSLT